MDAREVLYTTRAMRRVKPDPIPLEVQQRILDAAIRAPSGGNQQNWRFLVVTSPEVKAKLGPIYRKAMASLWANYYKGIIDTAKADPTSRESVQWFKVQKSAQYLADNFEVYPLLLFGFSTDGSGGSVYPAAWSAQLTARAEGVGSALTSVLRFHNDDVLPILGVPADSGWHMVCMLTFGYPTGRWGVAPRQPVHEVAYAEQWGQPLPYTIADPLWVD